MINLELLNKERLLEFINSSEYSQMPVLPISYHRAISHINNPRATNNDVLLILAFENNQLLGYLGILPDDIYTSKGEIFHVGWLSCIWVSQLARGKGIAKKMVLAAYESYKNNILITNFTKEAGSLYHKLNIFDNLHKLEGIRFYRKMCLSGILPKRFPKTASLKWILKIIDLSFNLVWKTFLKETNNDFDFITEIPSDSLISSSLINNCQLGFKRQEKEFRWILSYPWIKQVERYSEDSKKYHFSSEEKKFTTESIKVRYKNQTICYFLYVLRDGHLRIPYIIYNSEHSHLIALAIKRFAQEKNAEYVSLFLKPDLSSHIRIKSIFKKNITRHFLITKDLKEKISDIHTFTIFDGDGDAAFT